MIAQGVLALVLLGVIGYAWTEYRRSPVIAALAAGVAAVGTYFVWFPAQSTRLAELVGIGRGVDLIIYIWVVISLLVLLNLHLKLRMQLELITLLARRMALANARPGSAGHGAGIPSGIDAGDAAVAGPHSAGVGRRT